jgi:hypothetical protein
MDLIIDEVAGEWRKFHSEELHNLKRNNSSFVSVNICCTQTAQNMFRGRLTIITL